MYPTLYIISGYTKKIESMSPFSKMIKNFKTETRDSHTTLMAHSGLTHMHTLPWDQSERGQHYRPAGSPRLEYIFLCVTANAITIN